MKTAANLIKEIKRAMARKKHMKFQAIKEMGIASAHFYSFMAGGRQASLETLKALEEYGVDKQAIDAYAEEKLTKVRHYPSKRVGQYTLDGKFIKLHLNVSEAARELGLMTENLRAVCQGYRKSLGGFLWRYTESVDDINEPTICQHCGKTVGGTEKVVISLNCLQEFRDIRNRQRIF